MTFVALQGSEKQIAWASTLRETVVRGAEEWGQKRNDQKLVARCTEHVLNQFPQASWWIENRRTAEAMLCNEIARQYDLVLEKRAKKLAAQAVAEYERVMA